MTFILPFRWNNPSYKGNVFISLWDEKKKKKKKKLVLNQFQYSYDVFR